MNLLNDKSPRFSLVGNKFSRLLVMSVAGYTLPPCGKAEWFYVCKCECGNEKNVSGQNLIKGASRSCGCMQKEHGATINLKHGASYSPTYNSWAGMIQRCTNNKHDAFKNYGERGITVCDRWQVFENFLHDMGHRPDGKTLDRIDNDKGYFLGNCRWATPKEQTSNKRKSLRVIYKGQILGFLEAARMAGLSPALVKGRKHRGWSIDKIIDGAEWYLHEGDS